MSTGNFDNWDGDISAIGPIYPFVGWEVTMVVIVLIAWIVWHIVQIRMENKMHDDHAAELRQGNNLHKAAMEEHSVERM